MTAQIEAVQGYDAVKGVYLCFVLLMLGRFVVGRPYIVTTLN